MNPEAPPTSLRLSVARPALPPEPPHFYDDDFGFRARLEAAYPMIREEWERVPAGALRLWPEPGAYSGRWVTMGLVGAGTRVEGNCKLCPRTAALVDTIPGVYSAGYSILDAHSFLPRHRGRDAGVLRCHLGLVIPERCGFMVDAEIRRWTEGGTLVFDDTIEHESWNRSPRAKVLFLLDFEKPWLSDEAKALRAAQRERDLRYYRSLFPDWV